MLLLSWRLVKLTDTKILVLSLNIFQISNSKFQIFSCELLRQVKKACWFSILGFNVLKSTKFPFYRISIFTKIWICKILGKFPFHRISILSRIDCTLECSKIGLGAPPCLRSTSFRFLVLSKETTLQNRPGSITKHRGSIPLPIRIVLRRSKQLNLMKLRRSGSVQGGGGSPSNFATL